MSNPPGGRPTKNERREQAREQARQLREEAKKRDRRNRVLLQSGIIVGVIAIALVITLVIINNVKPAGPGPQNMASGGVLLVSDGSGGIKVQTTAGLPEGADPVDSAPSAQIRIQSFVDLFCPICQQFELGLDYNGDGTVSQDEVDKYAQKNNTTISDDPSTLGDYVGNLKYIETLIQQGVASLEVYPVAILDRNSLGTNYSTRSANAADAVAAGDPNHFLDFLQAMYENQPDEGTAGLTDDQIISIAKGAGVDTSAKVSSASDAPTIEDAIKNQTFKKWVTAMTSKATSFGFTAEKSVDQSKGFGTPLVVVNGQQYTPSGTLASNSDFKSFILQVAGETSTASPTPTPSTTPAG